MTSKRRTGRAAPEERTGTTTGVEWLVAALGVILVAAALIILLQQAASGDDGPPAIATEVTGMRAAGGAYQVEVRVVNRGHKTAAEIKVAAALPGPSGDAETSDTVIDFLAPGSSRTVTMLFARDPRGGGLSLRVVSYLDP